MIAISLENISKQFKIDRSSKSIFKKEKILNSVLTNLNLEINKGSVVGIVGRNGSGKSTLLKILAGIMTPDSGHVMVNGSVASILELGMGFHPELSGRENIYIKSSMYGFSNAETSSILDSIIKFSELGDQIDDPVRTYSSGMYARLAFSIAINVKCDIVIIDEILSVGDPGFNYKCKLAFDKMKKEGKTIIIASHASGTLESICDFVCWLEDGNVHEYGNPHVVCHHFQKYLKESPNIIIGQAEAGVSSAQNSMGEMYRDGLHFDCDLEKAEDWFKRAIRNGSVEAMINLGDLKYANGEVNEAKTLYSQALDAGNKDAVSRLTSIDCSDEVASEAVFELRTLAESGNTRAIWCYANALFNGYGVPQNRKCAIEWMQKAAMKGEVSAMFQLGMCYRDGLGIAKDSKLCEYWLSEAANHGHARSRKILADSFRKGITVDLDMSKSIMWYKEAANADDADSMYQLGLIYHDGIGITKNEQESEYWMRCYSKQSVLRMEYELGEILFRRNENETTRAQSLKWYGASSDGNFTNACWQLGIMYRDGLGVLPDSSKAAMYFQKAADGWNSNAMYELAMLYLKGNGVSRNLEVAEQLLRKSSKCGNNNSRYMLGILLRNKSKASVSDVEEASCLIECAAEYGNINAIIDKKNKKL